ncbi:hypothetical protein BGX24_006956 [Mortierella sp. AD032]|nr:hypothetical protein BGX24_006956 [Mortierella sp. AD032]
MLVSKTWNNLFTPYLYKTIELTHPRALAFFFKNVSPNPTATMALLRHKSHVQTLKVSAINRIMFAILLELLGTKETDKIDDASEGSSVPLLPKSMREFIEFWRFDNLRHFEWSAPKGPATSSSSDSEGNNRNDDGSMTALQLVVLHIDRLETVSLKFKILTRQHVRVLKGLLRGGGGRRYARLRKVLIAYLRADVSLSEMRRFTWAALSLYKPLPVCSSSSNSGNNDDGDADIVLGDESRNGQTTPMLETFHLEWDWDGQYGRDTESDSDTENDGNDSDDGDELDKYDGNNDDEDGNSNHDNIDAATDGHSPSSALQPILQPPPHFPHPRRKSAIKNLNFRFSNSDFHNFRIRPLLERCPLLESLSLWSHESLPAMNELPSLLEKFCPQFKSLGLGSMIAEDDEIAQLVAGCVRRLDTTYGSGGSGGNATPAITITTTTTDMTRGLESFRILSQICNFAEISTLALGRYHGASLETLDFSQQTRFPSHLFLQLIKQCPRLRVLHCNIELRMDHQGQTIDYSTLFSTSTSISTLTTNTGSSNNDWPFAETLRFLDLAVYRGSDFEIESNFRHGDGSVSDRYIAYLYSQVARLTHLQELHLGGWMILLRIGWGLETLSNLKSLKVLDVREHTFIRWTEDEVTWMAENWTGLVEIWGVKGLSLQPVVQHLKALRPMLVVI